MPTPTPARLPSTMAGTLLTVLGGTDAASPACTLLLRELAACTESRLQCAPMAQQVCDRPVAERQFAHACHDFSTAGTALWQCVSCRCAPVGCCGGGSCLPLVFRDGKTAQHTRQCAGMHAEQGSRLAFVALGLL